MNNLRVQINRLARQNTGGVAASARFQYAAGYRQVSNVNRPGQKAPGNNKKKKKSGQEYPLGMLLFP